MHFAPTPIMRKLRSMGEFTCMDTVLETKVCLKETSTVLKGKTDIGWEKFVTHTVCEEACKEGRNLKATVTCYNLTMAGACPVFQVMLGKEMNKEVIKGMLKLEILVEIGKAFVETIYIGKLSANILNICLL